MQLHTIQSKTKVRKAKRVGRGGKRGTYSGRGIKGQSARAGHRIRPEIRDAIKKIPKLRGYNFHAVSRNLNVSLADVGSVYQNGEAVTFGTLRAKGLIKKSILHSSRVKIIGAGAFTKKLVARGVAFSAQAREAFEKAGGVIESAKTERVRPKERTKSKSK